MAYLDKTDIPGPNTFIPDDANTVLNPQLIITEEVFCSGTVRYYHQPVGLIVAVTRKIANKAANMVKITYRPGPTPYTTIRQIIQSNVTSRINNEMTVRATSKGRHF